MNRNRRNGKFKFIEKHKTIIFFWLFGIIFCSVWYGIVTHNKNISYSDKIGSEITNENRINSEEHDDNGDLEVEVNNFMGLKIVHLDLKGAPPKISYFKRLFPLLASLGATGLLIEYEDMFPYYKTLTNISSLQAYSLKEIETVNKLAQLSNLLIIPLIPTLGHLGFILKLEEFTQLRAIPEYPHVICPNNKKSFAIIFEMIDQIVEAHPTIKMIHIGANEVHYMTQCGVDIQDDSYPIKNRKHQLFLSHMTTIARYIRKKYHNLRILMFDDQLRNISPEELKLSEISNFVEPVVWKFSTDVYTDLGPSLWHMYKNIFPKIWISSAFKGATGSNKYLTEVTHHLENHRSWLSVISELKDKTKLEGIILTGRQRYDHFAVLCELVPVSLPSLALCLRLLQGYDDSPLSPPTQVAKLLDCDQPYGLLGPAFGSPRCSYPGGDVLDNILRFHQIQQDFENIIQNDRYKGWMNDYNLKYSFSNPIIVEKLINHLLRLYIDLDEVDQDISHALEQIYYNFTVNEWRTSFLLPLKNKIDEILMKKNSLLSSTNWPRNPLN